MGILYKYKKTQMKVKKINHNSKAMTSFNKLKYMEFILKRLCFSYTL